MRGHAAPRNVFSRPRGKCSAGPHLGRGTYSAGAGEATLGGGTFSTGPRGPTLGRGQFSAGAPGATPGREKKIRRPLVGLRWDAKKSQQPVAGPYRAAVLFRRLLWAFLELGQFPTGLPGAKLGRGKRSAGSHGATLGHERKISRSSSADTGPTLGLNFVSAGPRGAR